MNLEHGYTSILFFLLTTTVYLPSCLLKHIAPALWVYLLEAISATEILWIDKLQPKNQICIACKIRLVSMFLNGWKKMKRKITFCETWNLYEIQISVSFRLSSFGTQPQPFVSVSVLLSCYNSRGEQLWAGQAQDIYYLALYRKSLPTLVVEHSQ